MPVDFIPDSQTAKRIDFIPNGTREMPSQPSTIQEASIPTPFFSQNYIPKSGEERAALDLVKSEQTGLFPGGEQSPSPVIPFARGLNFAGRTIGDILTA